MSGSGDLERGRAAYTARQWQAAYAALHATAKSGADLELLARSAYLLGLSDEYFSVLDQAHQAHVANGDLVAAAECAMWIALMRLTGGDIGQGTGWAGRARRLVAEAGRDSVVDGMLLVPSVFEHEGGGDLAAAIAVAGQAAEIGRRHGSADLVALMNHQLGLLHIEAGHVAEGLGLLDESMLAVASGELSAIVEGIVYCGVIMGCRLSFDVSRAQEWTRAMAAWCAAQPDLVTYQGTCRVHRAELLRLSGAWDEALAELRRVHASASDPFIRGEAKYVEGDLHRFQGRYAEADAAYREASQAGREPQPGLALLRLAQGSVQAAAAMIRRACREAGRPELLAAAVEILIAADEPESAAVLRDELVALADSYGSGLLKAAAQQAVGEVAFAAGDLDTALSSLRAAIASWQRLGAPYDAARARVLIGTACHQLGDDESAALELDAARAALVQLGAAGSLARVDAVRPGHGQVLTEREIEVLRLVCGGATNRAIATELVLSERTVDRHVSNILTKIGVSSRTAAAAYAFERHLV